MRWRPRLDVRLRPATVTVGEVLEIDTIFTSRSRTPVKRVTVSLRCVEEIGSGEAVSRTTHFALAAHHTPSWFEKGETRLRSQFLLPPQVPATYQGTYAKVEYELQVYAQIPWWFDLNQLFAVRVRPRAQQVAGQAVVFTSASGGPAGDRLYAELSLDTAVFCPGDDIAGAIALQNVGHHNVQAIDLRFVCIEELAWHSVRSTHRGAEYRLELSARNLRDNEPVKFRFRLPDSVPVQTAGTRFANRWQMEVNARGRWGTTPLMSIPIQVLSRAVDGSSSVSIHRREVPSIGRERHAAIWYEVGQHFRMQLHPEELSLSGTEGVVEMTCRSELIDDSPCVVLRLRWPSTGMGLELRERKLKDVFSGRVHKTGVAAFDRKYTLTARWASQVNHLLTEAIAEELLRWGSLEADDEGVVAHTTVSMADRHALYKLLDRVRVTANVLDRRLRSLPGPPSLADDAEPWTALAERYSAQLERGSLFVHGLSVQGEVIAFGNVWNDVGEHEASEVRMVLTPPIAQEKSPDELPSIAHEAWTRVASACAQSKALGEVHAARVGPNELVIRLREPLRDPERVMQLVEPLIEFARAMRGESSGEPFRR